MKKLILACALLLSGFPGLSLGQATAVPDSLRGSLPDSLSGPLTSPEGRAPSIHHDSGRLTRLTSGVMPPDGLLGVEIAGRLYSSVHVIDGFLERISQKDLVLKLEAGPRSWLQLSAEIPYRTWSGGVGWIPDSGSGLGDGFFQATLGRPLLGSGLQGTVFGGGNLPFGSPAAGLTEDAFSPHLGGALTWRVWTRSRLPEMRVHLNFQHRWNKSEDTGYGVGSELFEPWFPKYPAATSGSGSNDENTFGAGVEFRKGSTAIWVEYSQDRIARDAGLGGKEQYSSIGAGMRWGLMEGWAIHADYLVALFTEDKQSDWYPTYPDLVMEFGFSRQLSFGGSDADGDGVRDRNDHCPFLPEDRDGFEDEDGCPDYDNDSDGIPDFLDLAPNAPEDFDGWQDDDGMPDPDNDGDGIFDWLDSCPFEAEDMDGYRDEDGCPEEFADRDGDGIEDSRDACPDQPEDLDGFEDDDGCPELDNDLDGIPDSEDACPNEPEDYDGDEDEDGCPE